MKDRFGGDIPVTVEEAKKNKWEYMDLGDEGGIVNATWDER